MLAKTPKNLLKIIDYSLQQVFVCAKLNKGLQKLFIDGSRSQLSKEVNRGCVLRSMNTPNLVACYSRTNLFQFSFMNRIAAEWNRLPRDIREKSSVADLVK